MTELKDRNIVLIGGAGFIGHHLALRLKELGAAVFIVDNLIINNYYSFKEKESLISNAGLYLNILKQRLELIKKNDIPLYEIDARDYIRLSEVLTSINPDAIIHLAAVAHADRANKDPYSTFDHSLRTLENALDIARSEELSIKHFIYFSSSMVYGNFPEGFVNEETLCNPIGIYGALKFAGEKMVIAYNQVFDLPYTIVRPSALYGERCVSRRVGQIFIENALQGFEINIKGDGSDRLDFTYIGDLVNGIIKILAGDQAKNQIFNMTYGESRSLSDIVKIIEEHFEGVAVNYQPKDKLMPTRGTLCVNKAKNLIDYNPEFPVERGFLRYIKWYRSVWDDIVANVSK